MLDLLNDVGVNYNAKTEEKKIYMMFMLIFIFHS